MELYQTIHEVSSRRCTDDGISFLESDRLDYISRSLKSSSYQEERLSLARIYRSSSFEKGKPLVVISSHVDELPTRPWSGEKMVSGVGACLHGTYDNGITNAVLLNLMLEGRLGPQAVIAFTGNEEGENGHEMEGAKQVVAALRPQVGRDFFLVLDVTAEGDISLDDFTIENVFPSEPRSRERLGEELKSRVMDRGQFRYIPDGWEDEAWLYDDFGFACCSLCIPTIGPMHENAGLLVRKKSVPRYMAALKALSVPYPAM